MGDLNYKRCDEDDVKVQWIVLGEGPNGPIELDLSGVAAVHSLQAAVESVTVAMKSGQEEDFVDRVAVALHQGLAHDPHSLCPVMDVLIRVHALLWGGTVVVNDEGNLKVIAPEDDEANPHWGKGGE